jgi:hypothetical protein
VQLANSGFTIIGNAMRFEKPFHAHMLVLTLQGMVLLTLTSWVPGLTPLVGEEATFMQNAVLIGALGVIALGTGGIKPNVSAFGADQFDETNPKVSCMQHVNEDQRALAELLHPDTCGIGWRLVENFVLSCIFLCGCSLGPFTLSKAREL